MAKRRELVLETLRASESPMSILDIAHQLRLHPNTVRFHLRALADNGRVETVESSGSSPGRPPLMFRAHRGMDPAGPRNYQLLADALATRLGSDKNAAKMAIEAGRAVGYGMTAATTSSQAAKSDTQATDRLVVILADIGFSPHQRSSGTATQIELRHCPFLDLVPEHEGVICPMHLGLMQGAMAGMKSNLTVERLEPFAEPDLCLAHLSSSAEVAT